MSTRDLLPRSWTIYQLTCMASGRRYVGQTCQTVNDRWKRHKSLAKTGNTSLLSEAIRKYGENLFCGSAVVKVHTQAEADDWETWLISEIGLDNLYNEQLGGNSGVPLTSKAEQKRRAGHKEYKLSEEDRRCKSSSAKALWAAYTPEQRAQRALLSKQGRQAQKMAKSL
jgi:group I intron endonuclease